MKRTAALSLIILFSFAAFADTTATKTDKESLVQELERTNTRFLKSVEGLSEAQWSFKPAPDKWSIAEVAEHVAASESFIRELFEPALKEPASKELLEKAVRKDEAILKMVPDRSKKFKAPEPLQPSNRFGSPVDSLAAFSKARAENLKLASGDRDLRKYVADNPVVGPLDVHGWLLFISGHSERHTLQIDEVKADPNFPKQ